jgi:ribosome biogenesis GTPase A
LAALLQKYRQILHNLGLTKQIAQLQVLEPSILANFSSQSPYRIVVSGELQRGKSTFINSLIGQAILPASASSTTANFTEIKWAPEPHAFLHFRQVKDAVIKEPQEVDLSQLQNYISSLIEEEELNNYYNYERIELYWPLELLRKGVEIIDTPGLSEFLLAMKALMTYIKSADMVLFVLAADYPVSRSEKEYIRVLRDSGYENIFYIANRIDMLNEDEIERVKQLLLTQFSSFDENIANRLFLMSARRALESRLHANREQLEQSGLLPFEEMLQRFLGKEYKPMKFPQLMTNLQRSIYTAKRISISEGLKNSYFDLNELESQFLALIKQDT